MLRRAIVSSVSPTVPSSLSAETSLSNENSNLENSNLEFVTSSLATLKILSDRNTELQCQLSKQKSEFNQKLKLLQDENSKLLRVNEGCEWEVVDAREDCAQLRAECAELRVHIDHLSLKLREHDMRHDIERIECAIQVQISANYTTEEVNQFITNCDEGVRERDALLREIREMKHRNELLIVELQACMQNYKDCKQEYDDACIQLKRQEAGLNAKLHEMVTSALQDHKSLNSCAKSTQVQMNFECTDGSSATEAVQQATRSGYVAKNGFDWSEECASGKSSSVCSMSAATQSKFVMPYQRAKTHTRSQNSWRDQKVSTTDYMIKIVRIYTEINQKEELMKKIAEQNQWMYDFNVHIVKAYRVNRQGDDEYTSVIINVFNYEAQASLLKRGKIIFNERSCSIYEHSNIMQCNHCQGFGHFVRNCQNAPACRRCGGCHDTYNCTKINPRPICANCVSANSDGNCSFNVQHRPTDSRCPIRMKQVNCLRKSGFMHHTNGLFWC